MDSILYQFSDVVFECSDGISTFTSSYILYHLNLEHLKNLLTLASQDKYNEYFVDETSKNGVGNILFIFYQSESDVRDYSLDLSTDLRPDQSSDAYEYVISAYKKDQRIVIKVPFSSKTIAHIIRNFRTPTKDHEIIFAMHIFGFSCGKLVESAMSYPLDIKYVGLLMFYSDDSGLSYALPKICGEPTRQLMKIILTDMQVRNRRRPCPGYLKEQIMLFVAKLIHYYVKNNIFDTARDDYMKIYDMLYGESEVKS